MTRFPTLRTARLTLRPMTADDWPAYCAMMITDRARFMGGPFTVAEAWGLFCHDHAQWSFFGCGALMMDTAEGTTVGQVGINAGPLFPERELGWCVYEPFEGHGYAFEAATALRDWAQSTLGLATLVSYIDPNNARSIALAQRLGARPDPEAPRTDPEDLVFRHFGQLTASETPVRPGS